MKKLAISLILLTALLFVAGCTEKTQENSTNSHAIQGKSAVVEVTQLEQINTALQKGPVFLKVGAEWCGECRDMKPILDELAAEYEGRATVMSVDIDRSPQIAPNFGVGSIPDSFVIVGIENGEYIYMQDNGNVSKDRFKARVLGLRDKEVFENVLNLAILHEEQEKSR